MSVFERPKGSGQPSRRIDHLNYDTLDNRRSNLKAVTGAENRRRRRPSSTWKRRTRGKNG